MTNRGLFMCYAMLTVSMAAGMYLGGIGDPYPAVIAARVAQNRVSALPRDNQLLGGKRGFFRSLVWRAPPFRR
jgi:hypothetical protein